MQVPLEEQLRHWFDRANGKLQLRR